MPVDAHTRIVLRFGQTQDLSPDLGSLGELAAEIVETGEASKDREQLWGLLSALEQLHGADVRLLHFVRVPVTGQQRPG